MCLRRRMTLKPRYDDEGLHHADVEVLAQREWKDWKGSLSPQTFGALRLWRGGAVVSPTRLVRARDPTCPFCHHEWASARHLFADCPHFEDDRKALQLKAGFDAGWWSRQPAYVLKSGWITFDAAASLGGRTKAAIAANHLGATIVEALCGTNMLNKPKHRH